MHRNSDIISGDYHSLVRDFDSWLRVGVWVDPDRLRGRVGVIYLYSPRTYSVCRTIFSNMKYQV